MSWSWPLIKSDRSLGMHRDITRRDFIQKTGLAALGTALAPSVQAGSSAGRTEAAYPPTRTGLRGSHPGSFEAAHALRDGARFSSVRDLDERYDLIVVGAGISGLAAAHYYRQHFGEDARILILENHDDFGGHARRNEFHQGGPMRLALGGTQNLEHWQFSGTVRALMRELGVNSQTLRKRLEFDYGFSAPNGPAIWFDEATYGVNKLVTGYTLEWWEPGVSLACIDEFPLSEAARKQLKNLYRAHSNVLAGKSEAEVEALLTSISYPDFMRRYAGMGEEALQIFQTSQHPSWALELRALSAEEGFYSGLPGLHLVGWGDEAESFDYPVAMFPDGNASIARLLVQRLIPAVAPGTDVHNIALAKFDYALLDRAPSPVRLRLNSTVVNAENAGSGVRVTYLGDGVPTRVAARHCVMACYHSMLPYLCPTLPDTQKEAQRYQVKIPLVHTNVLLRSSDAMDSLGIDSVRCPGRMHRAMCLLKGINTGGYEHPMAEAGPVPLGFWGTLSPPPEAHTLKDQLRGSREKMLALAFEDYEREVRTVLDGLLGPAGFDVRKDVLAITVNRWPHGYAYEYMQLWDEDFADGQAPHQVASQPHGRIVFANSDAGASAYTHAAIDEAHRAVSELS